MPADIHHLLNAFDQAAVVNQSEAAFPDQETCWCSVYLIKGRHQVKHMTRAIALVLWQLMVGDGAGVEPFTNGLQAPAIGCHKWIWVT